jgi:hypothetical protein
MGLPVRSTQTLHGAVLLSCQLSHHEFRAAAALMNGCHAKVNVLAGFKQCKTGHK